MQANIKILKKLKTSLINKFGDNIKEVILFGSQVTGKAHENSDYDVLIILNNDYDWRYKREILHACYDIELEHDIFIDIKIISVNELNHSIKGQHPLYEEAINKGIQI